MKIRKVSLFVFILFLFSFHFLIYSLFTYCFYFFIFILFLILLASYNLKKPLLNFIFYLLVSVLLSSFLVNLSTYSTVRSRPFNTSRLNDFLIFFLLSCFFVCFLFLLFSLTFFPISFCSDRNSKL